MFQYAAGRALSIKNNTSLLLDKLTLDENPHNAYTQRNYELHVFSMRANFATTKDLAVFSAAGRNRIMRKLDSYFLSRKEKVVFNESGQLFHEQFFQLPEDVYLNGFWQSEKYFEHIRTQLLEDFVIRQSVPTDLMVLLSRIKETNSISLHVRRGDYVSLKSANEFHGLLGVEYYQHAIDLLYSENADIELFIFSDDIDWCQHNLKFNHPTNYVMHNHSSVWDMYMMSHCKHNVIANSSFSWWGAWLNLNPLKTVVLPEFWFNDVKTASLDILAKNWRILS